MVDARGRGGIEKIACAHAAPLALEAALQGRRAQEAAYGVEEVGFIEQEASCPLSLSISTKETFAATAFNACTMARLSRVG